MAALVDFADLGGGVVDLGAEAESGDRAGDGADADDGAGDGTFDGTAPLPPFVSRNLLGADRLRYRVPTPIQKHTVPLALAGHDVMACAQVR